MLASIQIPLMVLPMVLKALFIIMFPIQQKKQHKMHDSLINKLDMTNRGKKKADFHVLKESSMPARLLEYLFIDNKSDNNKLSKKSYRNFLGQITAETIAEILNLKKR